MATVLDTDREEMVGEVTIVHHPEDHPQVTVPGDGHLRNFERVEQMGVDWIPAVWLGIVHLGCLAAPFFFSWSGLVLAFALHWLTGGIGICLGYHRLLTHDSFKTYPIVRYAIALIGGLAGEGPAVLWVANHRKHHAFSDQEGDPHSPHDGGWWSHVLWAVCHRGSGMEPHCRRWCPDMINDPVLRFLGHTFILWHLVLAATLTAIGYAVGGWWMACSWLFWGMAVRLVFVLHSTWFVNSASHIWGYRNYETTDDSRNNWWVAAVTYGEGWHNNHHAYPRMARHGHQWWEIDLTFMTIRLMEKVGLAWDVVDAQHTKRKHLATVVASGGENLADISLHRPQQGTGSPHHGSSKNVAARTD